MPGGIIVALCKERIDDRGIVTRYHRVGNISFKNNLLILTLESYPNEEYRRTAQPASIYDYYFETTVEEEESMGIRQLCYARLKALNDWADATDC